jgi:hypothetical protein
MVPWRPLSAACARGWGAGSFSISAGADGDHDPLTLPSAPTVTENVAGSI